MISSLARFTLQWLTILVGTATLVTGAAVTTLGQPPANEGVEQIECRIHRQREENLHAVHALIERLSAQFAQQRAQLAKEKSRVLSLGGLVPDPGQELLALQEQLEAQFSGAPPRPSPDAPYRNLMRDRAPDAELPGQGPKLPGPLIDNRSPFEMERHVELTPAQTVELQHLRKQVKQRYEEMRGVLRDMLRARAILRLLGDDTVPPPPAPAPSTNQASPDRKRNG